MSISPGSSWTLQNVPPDTYNIMIVTSDSWWAIGTDVTISAGETTLVEARDDSLSNDGWLQIINNSSHTISDVFLVSYSSSSWGADQLTDSISPGNSWTLWNIEPSAYKLRVVASDGYWNEQSSLTISIGEMEAVTLTDSIMQPPLPTTGTLKITNSTSRGITEIYFPDSSALTWGADLLSTNLTAGTSWTKTDLAPGTYKLRVVTSDSYWYEQTSVTITAGLTLTITITDSYLQPPPPTTGTLTVTNSSGHSITEVYFPLSTASEWGADLLATSIAAGTSWSKTDLDPGTYKLRVVTSDNYYYEQSSVAITAGQTSTITVTDSYLIAPTTGSVQINNNSSDSITEIYIALPTDTTWGSNRISTSIAASGTKTITGIAPDTYWIKLHFSTKYTYIEKDVGITAGVTYTINTTGPNTGAFMVVNSSSDIIWSIHIRKDGAASWDNILSGFLDAGYSATWYSVFPGAYDARLEMGFFSAIWYDYNVNITAGQTYTWQFYGY